MCVKEMGRTKCKGKACSKCPKEEIKGQWGLSKLSTNPGKGKEGNWESPRVKWWGKGRGPGKGARNKGGRGINKPEPCVRGISKGK